MTQPGVVVVGAGVVGLSAALALHEAGAKVTVVSADEVGDGASASNAGLLVPPDSVVWPGPGNRRQVPRTLLGRGGASIAVHWRNPAVLGWGARFLLHSTEGQYWRSTLLAHGLSDLSLGVLSDWATKYALDFDLERNGMTFLFADAASRDEAVRARQPLVAAGETYVPLDQSRLASLEPAWRRPSVPWVALHAPSAAHGDTVAFCRGVAAHLTGAGVRIHTHRPVTEVVVRSGRVRGVQTASGQVEADDVVLATGIATASLARRAGQPTTILPVKGTAATVPILVEHDKEVPAVGGVLEDVHVAYSRTRTHLRLSTGAEIGSSDLTVTAASRTHLRRAGESLFPGALDWASARFEAGFRPMTAHGLPLIGPARVHGLWIDSGHGSLGWTQAAGSGALLAALLTGSTPPLDPAPFRPPGSPHHHQKELHR